MVIVIFSLLLLSQLHHHHSRKSSGLCAQTTLPKTYRHPACLDSCLNLVDREIALRTYKYCGIITIRRFAQLIKQLCAWYFLIAVSNILASLYRLLQEMIEMNHLVYLWLPRLMTLLYSCSDDLVKTHQLNQTALGELTVQK